MVMIPITPAMYAPGNGNTSYPFALTNQNFTNPDGSNLGMATYQSSGSGYGIITFTFWGKLFGLRVLHENATNDSHLADFAVGVDGEWVNAYSYDPILGLNTNYWAQDPYGLYLTHNNLSDGKHYAQIVMNDIGSNGSTPQQGLIHGVILDGDAGYREPKRSNKVYLPVAVPTSMTQIPTNFQSPTNAQFTMALTAYRRVIYANTNAFPCSITIEYNSVTISNIYLAPNETVAWPDADMDTISFGLGGQIGNNNTVYPTLSHQSSATGINFTVIA